MNRLHIFVLGSSVVSAAVAGTAGYLYAKRTLEEKYVAIAEQEIAEAKRFYSALKKEEYPTPEEAVEKLIPEASDPKEVVIVTPVEKAAAKAMVDYAGASKAEEKPVEVKVKETVKETEVDVEVVSNIFVDGEPLNPDDFDIEVERDNRRNGVPYVLSKAEYDENEFEHDQECLTYFKNDDTLTDDRDQIIDDVDRMVGLENLKRFGHGSGDPKIVYIRNEEREMDFEIVLSSGSYLEEVAGMSANELRHSYRSPARRFRHGDDE